MIADARGPEGAETVRESGPREPISADFWHFSSPCSATCSPRSATYGRNVKQEMARALGWNGVLSNGYRYMVRCTCVCFSFCSNGNIRFCPAQWSPGLGAIIGNFILILTKVLGLSGKGVYMCVFWQEGSFRSRTFRTRPPRDFRKDVASDP